MPKKMRNVLSNIFSRNKSQLESDAVPTNTNLENNTCSETPVDTEEIISSPTGDENLALALQESNVSPMMNLYNPAATAGTNNILAVNNTQGQVIYQFTNIKGLQLGSVFHINTKDDKNGNGKQQKRVTRTINEMMKSQNSISRKMLDCISTHLGEGWQDVMRQLNFSEGQIHQRTVDYKGDGGMKEVMYQLLLEWSSNDDEATLGKITQILWTAGQIETVEYMKKTWKRENNFHPSEKPV